jgi:hypothetical protein
MSLADSSMKPAALLAFINPPLLPLLYVCMLLTHNARTDMLAATIICSTTLIDLPSRACTATDGMVIYHTRTCTLITQTIATNCCSLFKSAIGELVSSTAAGIASPSMY